MIKYILILFFILNSCAYPDIDSVPEFDNMYISIQDSIELCKLSNSDNDKNNDKKDLEEFEPNNHLRVSWLSPEKYTNKSKCFDEINKITNRL